MFKRAIFTGRTTNPTLNTNFLGLEDGKEYAFEDFWQSSTGWSRPSTYLAFGRNSVESNGGFLAWREGDLLSMQGTVTHGFIARERFDFNPGQLGHKQASLLESAGQAKPFAMQFEREQDVEAELRYEPDGSLTLLRASWGAIR